MRPIAQLVQGLGPLAHEKGGGGGSISVRNYPSPPSRTACHYGLSTGEIDRLDVAMHFLRRTRKPFVWIVAGDGLFDVPERQAREAVRVLKSDLVQILQRAGKPAWWLEVVEATRGYHSNLVVPHCHGVERLRDGRNGFALQGAGAIQHVSDWRGLRDYLAGERTPQADFARGHTLSARAPGSHTLETRQSGDRVRISDALAAKLAGRIAPYSRSYAKPLPIAEPVPAYVAPSPELVAVVAAQVAPLVPIIEEVGGQLAFPIGEPTNLAAKAEERRKAMGLSQDEAAARLGISRPTLANAAAGRYRLSPWALQRAAEFLKAA